MSEDLRLKPIRPNAVEEALARADHYRLLNQPGQAESICRDILRVEPGHQPALVMIVLALTDQYTRLHGAPRVKMTQEYVARIRDEYQRLYYGGLVLERQARALLQRGMAGSFAYDGFRQAMELYDRAEQLRPEGNDDAILRWNSCLRTIRRANLRPRAEEAEPLLE